MEKPRSMKLSPGKNAGGNVFAFGNLAAVSPYDFREKRLFLLVNRQYIIQAATHEGMRSGQIGLTEPQRRWMNIILGPNELVDVEPYFEQVPFAGSMELEVSWYKPAVSSPDPIPQVDLLRQVVRLHDQQILSVGQFIIATWNDGPGIRITIKKITPLLTNSNSPLKLGILNQQTEFKIAKSSIPLVGASISSHQNAILRSDFSFQELGIGGLDDEFSVIFRRAFASRLFPPQLIDQMGIQHVRGLLLYGPPGTGKTLIARQIGKTLNAREPKIINGPELLNKFVGQSEENTRKIFADAEKEYKEKGDASGLHIIIFDELDAVCKQRGSGSSGGTGVGDNIVNQLLTKLDGVDQLNNILLIGMTNRKDLIDEALLRPGRLEVHLEISLPDEPGRLQIFKIHTQKLKENDILDPSISLPGLAARTKNYSGAEISGLVRLASSFAFARHTEMKDGKGPKIDDVKKLKVIHQDFEMALAESTPMFGTAEEDLAGYLEQGVIEYAPKIQQILEQGSSLTSFLSSTKSKNRLSSIILYGPTGSGKTALAAKIALDSGVPFIKVIKAADFIGMSDLGKVVQMQRTFSDADKSPSSIILLDNIENIIEYIDSAPPRFVAPVLSAMRAMITTSPPKNRRRLVIATTSERGVLDTFGVLKSFDAQIPIPNIESLNELGSVLQGLQVEGSVIKATLDELYSGAGKTISVGVKTVVWAVATSQESKNPAEDMAWKINQKRLPTYGGADEVQSLS